MIRMIRIFTLMLCLAALPLTAFSMSHESHEKGKSEEMMHQGHTSESHGDMMHEDKGKHEGHEKHMDHDDKGEHEGHERHMDHDDKGMHEEHDHMDRDDKGEHEGHERHMDHARDKAHEMHKEHGGHGDMGGMQVIDEKTEDGVKAVAKIMTYDPKMAEMAGATHHLMVFFTDEHGNPITSGKAAVRVKGDKGEVLELTPMGDGFGTDLKFDKGEHELEVGTRLEDGKKRTYEYDYRVE